MSVAGSTSSQGTHSRSPSRSRSPPYNDSRYRYSSRYDSYNYRPNRNGMSAALDDYRDLRDRERDRERDRDRDRPMGLMREDRFMSPRGGRDRDDRYTPYYRDDIPSSHHYSSSSSSMPRDYPKISTNSLRRDLSSDRDPNKLPSASSSVKDSKDDKPPNTPTEPYTPTSRYMDWRDRDRERDRDRRYREDDRRRDYDRRRDGYMRDMRYESSSYGAPPPNYQIPPFGGDSYRPDRDMPPSPSMPSYYERDHDRDFYNRRGGGAIGSSNSDYDRYRGSGSGRGGNRPSWSSKPPSSEDNNRRLDRDRPERINTDNLVRSERTSPTSAYSTTSKERELKSDDKIEQDEVTTSPSVNDKSVVNSPEQITTATTTKSEVLETGEVVEEEVKESEKVAISEQPQPSSPKPSPPQPEKMEITEELPKKHIVKKEEQEIVTAVDIVKDEQVSLESTTTSAREQGEVVEEEEKAPVEKVMTQEEIVNRISDIENQISMNEELLEAAIKREEEEAAAAAAAAEATATQREDEDVEMADDEDETAEDEAAQNKEEAKKQALHAMETEPSADMMDYTEDASSPIIRKRPQLLINQLRSKIDEEDDKLYEKILADNKQVAKENSAIKGWQGKEKDDSWSDEENWSKPLYAKIEDYPCYKENVAKFSELRIGIARTLTTQKLALDKKERLLKKEYKSLYEQWKEKNIALDRIRDIERRGPDRLNSHRMTSRRIQEQNQPEEYTDGVIFTSNAIDALRFNSGGASTPYNSNGLYTSDAARSEAELLEIIQSLESAEMRNPESRAKKTTATIPPMILDKRERMRTFDDRSGLVENPLTYYHTGPDTGDVWNQEEVTTFMESYMMYPKQFERISIAIGTKTACQCVLFYYRKKKKIDFKALMKKGRRGKATKHRDRIAAAIRLATGDSSSSGGRKTKSKGSALMADIGEAQNSRKAKEKDAERKSKELRDLEQANVYWDGVAERKKAKRPTNNTVSVPPISTPIIQSGPPSSASDDTDMMLTNVIPPAPTHEKRRTQSGSSIRRTNTKGRSPREAPSEPQLVLPGDAANATVKRYSEEQHQQQQQQQQQQQLQQQQQQQQQQPQATETTGDEDDDRTVATSSSGSGGGVTKWSEREKELAVEAFKEHGRDFVQVSGLVKSKTEEQCRNFYHNFKRKFGPNAFNEEDSRGSSTVSEDLKPIVTTDVHQELVAISGRTDLKAEEEDAAAALVGMFQMGSNTTPREESNKSFSRSRTPSGHDDIVLPPSSAAITSSTILPTSTSSMPIQPQHQPALQPQPPQPPQQPSQQRRRRIRSTSTKSETAADDATEWTDPDFVMKGSNSGSSTPGRKIGRQTTLTDAKRPAYSSYWSVSERNEFQRLLGLYGRDWDRLSKEMKSKTVIQVRNFYANNEEKMQLKEVVDRYQQQSRQPQPQPQPLPPPPQQPQQAPPPSYDTSAAHFQALQNFPFPQPIADQQPLPQSNKKAAPIQPYTAPPNDRGGYYTNDNYPPTSSTYHKPRASKNQSIASIIEPGPSAVTKVADLLNNDDPAEPNQNSWETWFGS